MSGGHQGKNRSDESSAGQGRAGQGACGQIGLPQFAEAKRVRRFLAFLATRIIGTIGQCVFHATLHDGKACLPQNRHTLHLERSAIEEHRVIATREKRCHLIEQSVTNHGKEMFCLLTDPGQLQIVEARAPRFL